MIKCNITKQIYLIYRILFNHRSKANYRFGFFTLSLFAVCNSSYSALSATTANTIQGTPPYLSYDGQVIITSTDDLLTITLSDNRVFNKSDAADTQNTPIILPEGNNFADIKTSIASGLSSENLTSVFNSNNIAWDNDGDDNFTATGALTITIKDVDNQKVELTDVPIICRSPYAVTLTLPTGTLSSEFGDPNSSIFQGSTATYYINAESKPVACFAKPNLDYDSGDLNPVEWQPTKGFKLQDTEVPNNNFPTTGFNGAFFDLTLANTTAAKVITDNGSNIVSARSGSSNVTLSLTIIPTGSTTSNILRVALNGPSSGQTSGLGPIGVTGLPATFELKSDTNTIYSFTISKWFIPKSGSISYNGSPPNAQTYCSNIAVMDSSSYSVPSVLDYTNAFPSFVPGTDAGGIYIRAIKGGIFSEWGHTYNGYYTSSDWESSNYWSNQQWSTTDQYGVSSQNGFVFYNLPSVPISNVACVSP